MPVPKENPEATQLIQKQLDFSRTVPMGADARIPHRSAKLEVAGSDHALTLPQQALDALLGLVQPVPRYRTRDVLGLGATGAVYAVEDRNLSRVVAVKVFGDAKDDPEEIWHYIKEAQIVASLTHPNVLPIYDLDVTSDGRVYFTMPRIKGCSLGAVIEASGGAVRDPRIAQASDVVRIGVAVAQALACAHAQRIIHQDVKPDNIMLGDFGEVLLVDWGSAVRLEPGINASLYGTPLFMSPEQARGEQTDERSDIYCLGATLFITLLLRAPTWSDDPEIFWQRKRNGELDEPTSEECARHPRVLLDILRKCLSRDPPARYQRIEALLADLHAYQNGLAVTAHRESMFERLRRWHRLHGRTFYIMTGLAALVAAVVLNLYGERLQEMAHWGKATLAADFTTPPGPEWKLLDGGFVVKDGWLVTTGASGNTLLLNRSMHGSTAVEYDGELLPGARPCDISLGWCRNRTLSVDGMKATSLVDKYELKVGAYDTSGVMIVNATGNLAYSSLRLDIGLIYHVRAEIEDDRLSLWVDGKLQCTWQDPFPFQDGYLYLYGHYPLKAFRNLRVYQRGVAQKILATGVGDAFAARGDYMTAADEYGQVMESHPGTALGDEARYRQGLCFWRMHQEDSAMASWQPLRAGQLGDRVRLHDLDRAFARGDHAATCAGIAKLWPGADAEIRTGLALGWARYVNQLRSGGKLRELLPYLDLHDRLLIDEHEVDGADADALLATHRFQEVADRFPNAPYSRAAALSGLGRYDEVIRNYPDYDWVVNISRLLAGQFGTIDPAWSFLRSRAMLLEGRFQQAYDFPSDGWGVKPRALMAMGRMEQAMAESPQDTLVRAECLLLLGRAAEIAPPGAYLRELVLGDAAKALVECPEDSTERLAARWRMAVEGWIAGDRQAFGGLKESDLHLDRDNEASVGFLLWIVQPFLQEIGGDHRAVEQACTHVIADHAWIYEQRPRFDALFLSGRIGDDAFLSQPAPIYSRARLLLLQALSAELAGNRTAALDHYHSWQASPAYERGEYPDPVLMRLVAWRLAALGDGAPAPMSLPVRPRP